MIFISQQQRCHHEASVIEKKEVTEMPAMPDQDPFSFLPCLLETERKIRHGQNIDPTHVTSFPYWADIIRLLQVHWYSDKLHFLDNLGGKFYDSMYQPYLDSRRGTKPPDFCTNT